MASDTFRFDLTHFPTLITFLNKTDFSDKKHTTDMDELRETVSFCGCCGFALRGV